jgi:cysteine-rich repeat protein
MGRLPCDDGNFNDGDGCSSNCSIEIGFSCTGGNFSVSDTCSEICGDGINMGQF